MTIMAGGSGGFGDRAAALQPRVGHRLGDALDLVRLRA